MKHFSFIEFLRSAEADRLGIDNKVADIQYLANICTLVDDVLDPLRDIIGIPIYINSGYRCKALNDAIGGSDRSQHMLGLAADISFGINDHLCEFVYHILKSDAYGLYKYIDQCILYIDKRFVHVSITDEDSSPRHMFFIR